jgi:hypothetical protein
MVCSYWTVAADSSPDGVELLRRADARGPPNSDSTQTFQDFWPISEEVGFEHGQSSAFRA